MASRYILTAFAQDRVGLVADITKIIFDSGCNLEDTEMTQLEDEFALILLFQGEREGLLEELNNQCRRMEREKGITAFIRQLEPPTPNAFESYVTHRIHVQGLDQAGIVYKISDFLTKHSCNIKHLHSHKRPSPESGTTIYTVEIEIEAPKEMLIDQLEQGLQELGQEMDMETSLH